MILNRKARRSNRIRPVRSDFNPMMEAFEKRELMTAASPFLQGTVYVDTAATGTLNTADAPLAGAKVSLFTTTGTTPLVTLTTGTDGGYEFNNTNVPGGLTVGATYKITETTSGYANTGAQALSDINVASVTSTSSIQVTVANPLAITTNYLSLITPFNGIYINYDGTTSPLGSPNGINLSVSSGDSSVNTSPFASMCVGVADDLTGVPFTVNVDDQASLVNGGRIAYLFNHYGSSTSVTSSTFPAAVQSFSVTDLVAATQVAIWDLEYNTNGAATGAFSLAGYSTDFTSATDYANIQTAAAALVADSVGKSEKVAILDASLTGVLPSPAIPTSGGQSVLATQSFNFYNVGTAPDAITGTVVVDATGNGLGSTPSQVFPTGDTAEAGVTVTLTGTVNGVAIKPQTMVTGANGTYSFPNLADGTYTVTETVPTGYVQTGPTSLTYTVNATGAGVTYPNNNFSNFMASCSAASLTNVVYKDNGTVISGLRGNTTQGSTVSVTFTVPTGVTETLSLVAYEAPAATFSSSTASQQVIVADQTGTFTAGTYTLQVTVPNSYYQVDFVCGSPITTLGTTSNAFYSAQNRLIDADNEGCNTYALSTLSGTVYVDANGNDSFGTGDVGLGGVTLTLSGTSSTGVAVPAGVTTVSAANGTYSFPNLPPGTYTVTETQPSGYSAEKSNPGLKGGTAAVGSISTIYLNSNTSDTGNNFGEVSSSVSGTVYVDATGIGLTTANLPPTGSGDTPEAGVTVNLYNSTGTVIATTTTASNGTYSFTGLPFGTYGVAEVVPSAQYQTGPNSLTYTVSTTAASPNSTGDNFSNYMQCSMTGLTNISYVVTTPSGTSKTVTNLRGNVAAGDTVTANFTIAPGSSPIMLSLVAYEAPTSSYSSSNAYLQVITSVVTGTYGPGTYSQTVTVPNSYYQVDFVCGAPLSQLELNGSHVDYNFENRLISADNGGSQTYALSTLSGVVYLDGNGNGSYGTGDTGLANVPITLTGTTYAGVSVTASTVTTSTGSYSFAGLAPGTYTITETQPGGYIFETSNVGSVGGTAGTNKIGSIALNSNTTATSYNFAEVGASSISGEVYYDASNSGWCYSCDTGISGVTLTLTGTVNGVAITPVTTTTGANGTYSFGNLAPGTYTVTEGTVNGYTPGKSNSGSITKITLTSGTSSTNDNFAEMKAGAQACGSQGAQCSFWNGWNGQSLIKCLNGSSSSTNLGKWLAGQFPTLFSELSGCNNSQVASYFQTQYNQSSSNPNAQLLASALDAYVTDSNLAGGTMAASYGFSVGSGSVGGLGNCTISLGSYLSGCGGPQGNVTLFQLFQWVDSVSTSSCAGGTNWVQEYYINCLFQYINSCGSVS